jgi:predicted  nucleic acid-binding Zn-ribbon protein
MKSEEKDRRSKIYLFIIIVVLFLINGVLIYNLISKDKKITLTESKLVDTSKERDELRAELESTELELADFKGQNASLDSIISQKEAELTNKVNQIKSLLQNRNLSKSELDQARKELASLKGYISRYKAEIDSLSNLNQFLRDENYAVKKEIEQEKERSEFLTKENEGYAEQVRIASQLKATNLVAEALKVKWNDKEKSTSRLASVDKISINFTLDKNEVATKGKKTIYLKIITPAKATLSDEGKGSGTFTFKGEKSLYTTKKEIDFSNSNEKVNYTWDKSPALSAGDYEVYLFCEDFIIGKSKFSLR